MYYLVFSILFWFSFVETFLKVKRPVWFDISYILMVFMVMFRYGQLTDYQGYEYQYRARDYEEGRDPLFMTLCEIFEQSDVSFEVFIMIIGAFSMGLMYPFFNKICNRSVSALFIFYCYAFLILPMSGMRQGICLSLLIGSYPLLVKGHKVLFYVITAIGSLIHLSMISVVLIGILYNRRWYNADIIKWIVLGMSIFALITPDLSQYTAFLGSRAFEADSDSRILQVAIRALLIIPVLLVKPQYGTHGYYAKAICIIGYCMYCSLSFNLLVPSRLEYFFRTFLCLFVAQTVFSDRKIKMGNLILGSILAIHVFLFFRNMNAFIQQGEYNQDKVTMYNFPYVSIFDKEELDLYK